MQTIGKTVREFIEFIRHNADRECVEVTLTIRHDHADFQMHNYFKQPVEDDENDGTRRNLRGELIE